MEHRTTLVAELCHAKSKIFLNITLQHEHGCKSDDNSEGAAAKLIATESASGATASAAARAGATLVEAAVRRRR